jgi:hypothetical protein
MHKARLRPKPATGPSGLWLARTGGVQGKNGRKTDPHGRSRAFSGGPIDFRGNLGATVERWDRAREAPYLTVSDRALVGRRFTGSVWRFIESSESVYRYLQANLLRV